VLARDFSRAALRESLARSRDRLGVDRLDLVLLHSPGADEMGEDPLGLLVELRDRGEVAHVGLSARSRRLSTSRRRAPMYSPNNIGGAVPTSDIVTDTSGMNHHPGSKSGSLPTLPYNCTHRTIKVPTNSIDTSSPMIRRGTSDAASVYNADTLSNTPISAGVTAIVTSTTAIGHRRRNNSVDPTSTPKTTPSHSGSPFSCENLVPSAAHSAADTTASTPSSTALRRRAHHHGPPAVSRATSPDSVMRPAYDRPTLVFFATGFCHLAGKSALCKGTRVVHSN
jgi:hypothetical protein